MQKPSMFSSSQLQVGFASNGTLSSINVASTPMTDKLFATVESAAKDKVLGFDATGKGSPACNAGPIIAGLVPIKSLTELGR